MRDIKTEFLASSFNYLCKDGLENMSIRNLCKNTGISIGSVYYWFESKDDLIVSAAEYGLSIVVERLLTYAVDKADDIDVLFDNFMLGVEKYSKQIKLICQVVASPLYGEKMRRMVPDFHCKYDKYAEILANKLKCPYEDIKAIVYLIASLVLDYSVWGSAESAKLQLEFIRKTVNNLSAK